LDTLRRNPPTPYWPGTLGYFQKGYNTNWVDQIFQTGVGHNVNANISGGNEQTRYYLSAGYNNEESYIINNELTRGQLRMNLEQKFSNKFKMGASAAFSITDNKALNAGRMYADAISQAPNMPVKDSLGNYLWRSTSYTYYGYATPNYTSYGSTNDMNPVGTGYVSNNYVKDYRALGSVFGELKLTSWLNFRSELGFDWFNTRAYNREIDKIGTPKGAAYETNTQNNKYTINNLLNFNKSFGKHQLQAVIGQSYEKSLENRVSTQGTTFFNDQILSIGASSVRTVGADIQQSWALLSLFSRVDYTYNNKYLLGFSGRMDGSSKFAYNNRYLKFPSFAAGWIVSNENFMKNIKVINELKLRGSVGYTGTDGGGGYYGYQGQYALNGTNTYGSNTLLTVSSPANPNLKWQRTSTIDAGIDLKMLNNRLVVNVDYYNKYTKNLLTSMPMPGFMGFATQSQNLGEMRNSGFEVTLNSTNILSKNFRWTTSFNIGRNRNELTKLYSVDTLKNALNNSLSNGRVWLPGESATAFYMFKWGGVNPANGNPIWIGRDKTTSEIPFDILYATERNSTVLINNQRQYMGDALPKFFGGMENRFQWKDFDFGFFLSFAYGNKIFNGVDAALYNYTNTNAMNLSPDLLNYWKKPGDITNIPALVNPSSLGRLSPTSAQVYDYTVQRTSDRFLEDGSYIQLSNVTLAYNFPKAMLNRLGLRNSRIRLFAEANNVFYITEYSGIDPTGSAYGSSALSSGFDEITLPKPHTYRFGFKVGF
jgi:TonB-dependent starch-binding outer membrane protein SusC